MLDVGASLITPFVIRCRTCSYAGPFRPLRLSLVSIVDHCVRCRLGLYDSLEICL